MYSFLIMLMTVNKVDVRTQAPVKQTTPTITVRLERRSVLPEVNRRAMWLRAGKKASAGRTARPRNVRMLESESARCGLWAAHRTKKMSRPIWG